MNWRSNPIRNASVLHLSFLLYKALQLECPWKQFCLATQRQVSPRRRHRNIYFKQVFPESSKFKLQSHHEGEGRTVVWPSGHSSFGETISGHRATNYMVLAASKKLRNPPIVTTHYVTTTERGKVTLAGLRQVVNANLWQRRFVTVTSLWHPNRDRQYVKF